MELASNAPVRGPGPAPDAPGGVRDLVRATRPAQWTKNALVLVAPGAAGALVHWRTDLQVLAVFAIFCAASSATYLLNDTVDAESDRLHPHKQHRPIAAGRIRPALALATAGLLFSVALVAAGLLAGWELVLVVASYGGVTVAYSLWLKREPVIEMTAVALGFVLRAVAGGVATHVPLSSWFLVVTSFGALLLVIGKRAGEYETLGEDRAQHRSTLGLYTPQFLRSALTLSASAALTTYCLWAFDKSGLSHRGDHLVLIELSVAPVIAAALYVLRILDAGTGGSPSRLLLDNRTLQVLTVSWAILVGLGIYA